MSVKWIKLELIDTFECLGVNLLKCDPIFHPFKDVDLLHDIDPTFSEVSLPSNGHLRLIIPLGGLLVFSVGKNNKGDPELY